jgi:hypothetical protein
LMNGILQKFLNNFVVIHLDDVSWSFHNI